MARIEMTRAIKIIVALSVTLFPLSCFGQATRWDWQVTTINQNAPQPHGMYPVMTIPQSSIAFCNSPANAVPCTNYATTYTSSAGTGTCPSNAQLTRSNSSVCVSTADAQGGFGAWFKPGNYQYTITTQYGSFGPFDFSVGFGTAVANGSNGQLQYNNSGLLGGTTGVTYDGSGGLSATGAITANSMQGELNAQTFATPEAAVIAACAGNKAVYFPNGTYNVSTGFGVCNSLHMRCATRAFGSPYAGAVFKITGKIWGLANPNADNTSVGGGVNGVHGLTVENCSWDVSTDPTNVLGAWRIKGISQSTFISNIIISSSNTNPAITEDGSNFNFVGGDYDNDFVSTTLYDFSTTSPPTLGGSTGIGIYVTSCSTFPHDSIGTTGCPGQVSGGSNDNHHFGGSISKYGKSVYIENGNNNSFLSIDGENATNVCVTLTGSSTRGNRFQRFRCEVAPPVWSAGTRALGYKILDSNNNYQTVSVAGTTGGSAPSWCTTLNCTTLDGSVVWTLTQVLPVTIRASGTQNNFLDIHASGTLQEVDDSTQWNFYETGTAFGPVIGNSVIGGAFNTDARGWSKWGFGKFPSFVDNFLFQGGVDAHGSVQSDRQFLLCNFTNGCYNGGVAGAAISTYATSGAGSLNAVIVITSTSNGVITGVRIDPNNPGTGFAVNDTITSIAQTTSSGTGAILTVSSIGTGGSITGLTITNGGLGGYAIIKATNIGNATYSLPTAGGTFQMANTAITAPSITLNGGTPWTSSSSANAQVVTCPSGGTTTQYCGADGAWHSVSTAAGACTRIGSLASPFTLTGTTSITAAATIAVPALSANSSVKIHANVFGNTGNTGTLTVGAQWGGTGFGIVGGISLANAYEIIDWDLLNEGSTSAQIVGWRYGKPVGNVSQNGSEYTFATGAGVNLLINFTPSLAADTWILKAADVILCP
jgi:hypothetical protein